MVNDGPRSSHGEFGFDSFTTSQYETMSTKISIPKDIPVVAIGRTRVVAVKTDDAFIDSRYQLVAVLDLKESPSEHQFSPVNLGTVLYTHFPRVRALVAGTAIGPYLDEINEVWKKYSKDILIPETGHQGCLVEVHMNHAIHRMKSLILIT